MYALSILNTHSPYRQPRGSASRQGLLGLPGNVGASSVTVPTSRDRRPRSTAVAASTPNQAHRRQPAACARQRFGSPCSFGHFDSCATQAPPCFPSCTNLRSRDTRTQGRGPAQAWTKTSGNRPWRRSNLSTTVTHGLSGAACRDHTMAMAFLCPTHCATSFPITSVWVCRQPCQIVSDPRIWKCKTPRRAE